MSEVKVKEVKEKMEKEEKKVEKVEEKIEKKEEVKENVVTPKAAPKKKKEYEAVVNIYTSFNNTIAHVTDMSGRTIAKVSGGMVTKHSRLKANPTIAMFISKRIAEKMKEFHIGSVYVRVRTKTRNPAPGPGVNAIIKTLGREGFKIINILDTSRIPRGGPKKKGGRRGRRP